MTPRINLFQINPKAMQSMLAMQAYVDGSGLETRLLHLVKMRASQINGCAYCLDMHSKDLRAMGEPEQRLHSLPAWRECPYYTPRERAALAWAEAVTEIADDRVPDGVYEEARAHFTEKELADLTVAVATINAWNRLSIAARLANV